MRGCLLLFVLGSVVGIAGQTRSFTNAPIKTVPLPLEMSHEPTAKTLVANPTVRAYRIELAPGAQTSVDRHEHDFLVVSIGDNNFEFAGAGNAYAMQMSDGEVQVMKGRWAHRVVNKSDRPLRIVEVEVAREIEPEKAMCGLNAQSCTGSKFAENDDTSYVESPLFETATVRLGRTEIGPGKGMPEHGHRGDHLMIALNDQQITNAVVAGDITQLAERPGDAVWLEGGIVHRVMNRGASPARFLTVEVK